MKTKIATLFLLLLTAGCATTQPKQEVEFQEGDKITLPSSTNPGLVRSPFLNTQKSQIFKQNGIVIYFYYGIGGRYLVQIVLPDNLSLDFAKAEATLLIDYKGDIPETISLSASPEGLFQGQGNIRNQKTDFKLELSAPAPGGGVFKKDLEFSVVITDNFVLSE